MLTQRGRRHGASARRSWYQGFIEGHRRKPPYSHGDSHSRTYELSIMEIFTDRSRTGRMIPAMSFCYQSWQRRLPPTSCGRISRLSRQTEAASAHTRGEERVRRVKGEQEGGFVKRGWIRL